MDSHLLERIVKLETLTHEKQEHIKQDLELLKQQDLMLANEFTDSLDKHAKAEMEVMNRILAELETIKSQTAHYKSMLGGIILTVVAIWGVLSQLASWLHLDVIKLLSSTIEK